ncbi:hypothetical protein GPJ56_008553 [Histomonas meleagridis]|uniref:uncharacterized protein n=1 Tax=Histomonas meleagridis TaxID=135588 RepID=UPI00355969BD|nr:hypothetical protein GPJ56_008553 [Histomonas meleagridis]KAH0798308.1 hypothetical protein GO595_008857 [Histomonas meleagridis]
MQELVQQLNSLYSILCNPQCANQELIDSASNQLMVLYDVPETLFALFQLFSQTNETPIRLSCAIAMKTMVSNIGRWEHYQSNDQGETIKQTFIQYLSTTDNMYLFQNILSAAGAIMSVEAVNWPEYFQLLEQFSQTQSEFHFNASLQMASVFLDRASHEVVGSVWGFFINLCQKALTIQNEEIIKSVSDVISKMFNFAPEIIEGLDVLYVSLFQIFIQLISNNSNTSYYLIDIFKQIAESEYEFPNLDEIIKQYLQIAIQPSIDINIRCLLLGPVNSMLAVETITTDNLVDGIIDCVFKIATDAYIDDVCIDDQENMNIAIDTIEVLAGVAKQKQLYNCVMSKSENLTTVNSITVYAETLIVLIGCVPEMIHHQINTFIQFSFSCIQTNNHTVQEAGYEVFSKLFERLNDAYYNILETFLTITFNILKVPHPNLISKALVSLHNLLEIISITETPKLIVPIFTSLCQVLQIYPVILQSRVIDCFTALTKSCKEEISIVSNEMLQTIVIAAQANQPEEVNIKASAIECLGFLIRYVPQTTETIISSINICMQCITSEDNILISSGMMALEQIIRAKVQEIIPYLGNALSVVHSILSSEPSFEDDEDKNEQNNIIEDTYVFTLNFLNSVIKIIPESIRGVINILKEDLNKMIKNESDEFQLPAIKCAASLNCLIPEESQQFLILMIKQIQDTLSTKIVSLCFTIFSKIIIKKSLPLSKEIIDSLLECAFQGMRRDLSCQEDYQKFTNYNYDFGDSLYELLRIIAYNYPQIFPIDDFWKLTNEIFSKCSEFEKTNIISVLSSYYSISYQAIPNLMKKFLVQTFVESLKICDFYTYPYPIASVREVAEHEPELLQRYLPQIFGYIDEVLSTEYDAQLTFAITLEFTVSLLFTLWRKVLGVNFDVQKFSSWADAVQCASVGRDL